jgi:hypothetical protein
MRSVRDPLPASPIRKFTDGGGEYNVPMKILILLALRKFYTL